MNGDEFVHAGTPAEDFFGGDGNIRGLPGGTTSRLMHHYATVRQCVALTLCSSGEKKRGHTGSLSDTICDDVALKEVHCIVDGHTIGHTAAWGVDIEADVLFGIFHLEEEHLRDDSISDKVVDRCADEYNTVAQ